MYLARYLFPEYSSKEDPSSPRRSRRQRSWGSASSSSANPYDCEYSFSSSQRFRASGIDRRKLEMTLYEKFGHDCQLQVCTLSSSFFS
ncbi:hypothetical protein IMZ48_42775 [Candidatus Bathyarchaeota archaeon]|nr:hypothetical protein [Candidatus Bathyarchaeota archaeon]